MPSEQIPDGRAVARTKVESFGSNDFRSDCAARFPALETVSALSSILMVLRSRNIERSLRPAETAGIRLRPLLPACLQSGLC